MIHPDEIQTLHETIRGELLREAEMDRLVAQLPATRRPVRAMLAAWLHALADRLQPSTAHAEQMRVEVRG
jgi:hypothetical protein